MNRENSTHINLKIGNYNIPLKYENEKIKFTNTFSNLPSIPFHKDMKMNDLIGELLSKIETHYSLIGPLATKKRKQEKTEDPIHERKCKEIIDKFNKLDLAGTGPSGEQLKVWDNETIIKVQSCELYKILNIKNMKDTFDPKLFLTLERKKMKLLKPLAERKITNEIFEVDMCEDNCITFMEKIEGHNLFSILENPLPEKNLKNLVLKIIDVIKEFHKVMEENDRFYGHGNLNAMNIIITLDKKGVQLKNESNIHIKLVAFEFENNSTFGHDWVQLLNIIKAHFINNENNYERGFMHEILNTIMQYAKKKTTYKFVKFEDFENSPSDLNLSCERVIEAFDRTALLSQGRDGMIKIWNPNVLVRIESCKQFNRFNYVRDPDAFFEIWKEKIKIIDILEKEGITHKIYEISKCGDNCITFMEKIEGMELFEFIKRLRLRTNFEDLVRNLLMRVINLILKFHSVMIKNGYEFGHGDLNPRNIMVTKNVTVEDLETNMYFIYDPDDREIKLIDFNFVDRVRPNKDFDFLFQYLQEWNNLKPGLIDDLKDYVQLQKKFHL